MSLTPSRSLGTSPRGLDCQHPLVSTPSFVTHSSSIRRALDLLDCFAAGNDTVLLEGESGTGKSYFARALHARSSRASQTFGSLNLGELDDALASSELFGHVRGAFTGADRTREGAFAASAGGTLLLDELGKASLSVQRKLMHVMEQRELRPVGSDRYVRVDVRLVFATNVSLARLVAGGMVLPDFDFRVGLMCVSLPPLRKRRADISELVATCIAEAAPEYGYSEELPDVDANLMEALHLARWPGNHRELEATLRRILAVARRSRLLSLAQCDGKLAYLRRLVDGRVGRSSAEAVAELEAAGGNYTRAARKCGISATQFRRRISA